MRATPSVKTRSLMNWRRRRVAAPRQFVIAASARRGRRRDFKPLTPPQSSTGGVMIGCWQSQGMVYVLVVEGDERSYQSLLDVLAAAVGVTPLFSSCS